MELSVLVIDDSVLFRQVISDIISSLDHVRVVGTAANGSIGFKKAEQLQPDVVTLDVEMPEMDGLETLPHIKKVSPNTKVIMVSSLTTKGAAVTVKALAKGAFDFIEKPEHDNPDESERDLRRQLNKIINVIVTKTILASDGKFKVSRPPKPSPQISRSTEEIVAKIKGKQAIPRKAAL